jgi:hypothetical protein
MDNIEHMNLDRISEILSRLDTGEMHLDLLDFLHIDEMIPEGVELIYAFLAVLRNSVPEHDWNKIRSAPEIKNIRENISKMEVINLLPDVISIINSFLNLFKMNDTKSIFKWSPYIWMFLNFIKEANNEL